MREKWARVSQRKTWRWRTAYCHPAVCRLFLGSIGFPLIESLKKSRLRPRAEGQRGRGAEGQRGRGAEGLTSVLKQHGFCIFTHTRLRDYLSYIVRVLRNETVNRSRSARQELLGNNYYEISHLNLSHYGG